ncbi:MAG: hypothetical protein ACRDRG_03180 [Pseudonocardiaceae bacterium]
MCTLTCTLVVAGDSVPIGHLCPDKLVHLCRAEASPFDLSGAKATHGPRDPGVPGIGLWCPAGIDGLALSSAPNADRIAATATESRAFIA